MGLFIQLLLCVNLVNQTPSVGSSVRDTQQSRGAFRKNYWAATPVARNVNFSIWSRITSTSWQHPGCERWCLWVHHLFDWSQANYTITFSSNAAMEAPSIQLRYLDTGSEILKLLRVLELPDEHDIANKKLSHLIRPLPEITRIARIRFIKLFSQLSSRLWSPKVSVTSANGMYPSVLNSQDEQLVRKWIDDFEAFPVQFPDQYYLSGFARLYALILRLNWDRDLSTLSQRFERLKEDYASDKVIATMSDWYHTLLLCSTEPGFERAHLGKFLQEHRAEWNWNVVRIAQWAINNHDYAEEVLNSFFCAPLRRGVTVMSKTPAPEPKTNGLVVESSVMIRF